MLKKDGDMRVKGQKDKTERKRNLMVMIYRHLINNGFIDTAGCLQREVNIDLEQYDVADNMDLFYVLQDFEEYYEVKFQKKPLIVKQLYANTKKGGMNKPPPKRKDSASREQVPKEESKGDKTPPLISGGGLSKGANIK